MPLDVNVGIDIDDAKNVGNSVDINKVTAAEVDVNESIDIDEAKDIDVGYNVSIEEWSWGCRAEEAEREGCECGEGEEAHGE